MLTLTSMILGHHTVENVDYPFVNFANKVKDLWMSRRLRPRWIHYGVTS